MGFVCTSFVVEPKLQWSVVSTNQKIDDQQTKKVDDQQTKIITKNITIA